MTTSLAVARCRGKRREATPDGRLSGPHLAAAYFWSSLVRIDLRGRHRRSVLGIGWSLLHPILMTAVLCAVFCPMFKADYRQFAPFLLAGLAFWNFLTSTALQGCHCFFQGESFIRQQAAPLAIYPLRTVLGTGIHGLAALTVVLRDPG